MHFTNRLFQRPKAYIPTIIALWFFDRREREPWQLAAFTTLSVILFFGMVNAHTLRVIDQFFSAVWVLGFVEEFWKIAPMLLLVFFIPRAVNGWRDGLVYGALGGLGFANSFSRRLRLRIKIN